MITQYHAQALANAHKLVGIMIITIDEEGELLIVPYGVTPHQARTIHASSRLVRTTLEEDRQFSKILRRHWPWRR